MTNIKAGLVAVHFFRSFLFTPFRLADCSEKTQYKRVCYKRPVLQSITVPFDTRNMKCILRGQIEIDIKRR